MNRQFESGPTERSGAAQAAAWLKKAAAFDDAHPARARVETFGLSSERFNGQRGVVVARAKTDAGAPPRAKVNFESAEMGTKAIKLENLKVVDREPFLAGAAGAEPAAAA